jgi:hypothetical protein
LPDQALSDQALPDMAASLFSNLSNGNPLFTSNF